MPSRAVLYEERFDNLFQGEEGADSSQNSALPGATRFEIPTFEVPRNNPNSNSSNRQSANRVAGNATPRSRNR